MHFIVLIYDVLLLLLLCIKMSTFIKNVYIIDVQGQMKSQWYTLYQTIKQAYINKQINN